MHNTELRRGMGLLGAVVSIEWCPCGQCAMVAIDPGPSKGDHYLARLRWLVVREEQVRQSFVVPAARVFLQYDDDAREVRIYEPDAWHMPERDMSAGPINGISAAHVESGPCECLTCLTYGQASNGGPT
jgi:hypothetical protein